MYRFLSLFTILVLIVAATVNEKAAAKYPPVLKYASKGSETSDLQFRLYTLGFLRAAPTGFFGTKTRHAVKQFQRKIGLKTNGIADLRTWKALKRRSLNRKDMSLLARLIHAEARGEGFKGQVAVGAVVMNRLRSPLFPKTLKAVMLQRNAFSAMRDGQFRLQPTGTAYMAAKAAVRGWDPSGHALFYYNPQISKSRWLGSRITTKRIGHHVFKL